MGLLLVFVLVTVGVLLPTPYVVFAPGPTATVAGEGLATPVIEVSGTRTYPVDGRLDLTTVLVTPASRRLDLVTALGAWLDPDQAVLPREVVFPPDATTEEVREANQALFTTSQDQAVVAALTYLGFGPQAVRVVAVLPDAPAADVLQPGDVIMRVDGTAVRQPAQLRDLVAAQEPGATLRMQVQRDGGVRTLDVPTGPNPADESAAFLGVQVSTAFEVDVTIDVARDIGGDSAGLVFALGVVDSLDEASLLDGRTVAGTGTIDGEGRVGAIGGVQQKIAAAREIGADVFLLPADNCGAARGARPGDVAVVPVRTLAEAVEVLGDGADRADLPSCATIAEEDDEREDEASM